MLMEESRRLALLDRLREVLGEEEARTLIECLPPVRWEQLATKDDVRASEERILTEMNGKFDGVDAKFDGVDAKFDGVDAKFDGVDAEFARVHTRIDGLEHQMDSGFERVWAEFTAVRGEIALQTARQTRTMVFIMSGFMLTIWGTLLGIGLT